MGGKTAHCRASTVKTGQATHCASNQPCILVHRCHFQLPPPARISQLDPGKEKKKEERRLNLKQCNYLKNPTSNTGQCEPAVASRSTLHAKRISNKGKPDTGNTSLRLSGHFQHFISNKERRCRAASNLLGEVTLRDDELNKNKKDNKRVKSEKNKKSSAALTRNEAKSMSTRLLAGESFAIFQIKAELCFAKSGRWIICGDLEC